MRPNPTEMPWETFVAVESFKFGMNGRTKSSRIVRATPFNTVDKVLNKCVVDLRS